MKYILTCLGNPNLKPILCDLVMGSIRDIEFVSIHILIVKPVGFDTEEHKGFKTLSFLIYNIILCKTLCKQSYINPLMPITL